jgi:hypothetical protein
MATALPRLFLARHGDTDWTNRSLRTGRVDHGQGSQSTTMDGKERSDGVIALHDDGATHEVGVTLA